MVTASHNPPTDNGLKLFVDGKEYAGDAESRIEERIDEAVGPVAWDSWGDSSRAEVLTEYRTTVTDYAAEYGADPEGTTVAVDCGNGMGSVGTPLVLRSLGAGVCATEANVDGHFPARGSKPTPETLSEFCSFVAETDAAFGFGHDGDADRIVVVDGDGEIVHEDTVLAMLAEEYTRKSTAEDPVVVTTPNASGRIDERVTAAGGRVERIQLGALHEGIARERARGDDGTEIVFAAEPWKHIHPKFGGWIDGVASATVLTRLFAAESVADRCETITERPYRKGSVDCPDDWKADVMATVEERLPERFPEAGLATEYGVRLTFPDDSWTLVRPSGTEPYVRVYAESDDVDGLVADVTDVVEAAVYEAGRSD